MAYQKGRGFNDIFGTLTNTFKPVVEGAANVGATLATGLVTDLLSGKTPKASIKERGNQAKGLVAQRALQSLQGGRGDVSPSSFGSSNKTAKRKRSRSKSQPPAKRSKQTRCKRSKQTTVTMYRRTLKLNFFVVKVNFVFCPCR